MLFSPTSRDSYSVLSADIQYFIRVAVMDNDEKASRFLDNNLSDTQKPIALCLARSLIGWI